MMDSSNRQDGIGGTRFFIFLPTNQHPTPDLETDGEKFIDKSIK
jgi:hypothetical protein